MRIAIDARAAAEVPAGRGRYVRELIRALAARRDDHEYLLYARTAWREAPSDPRISWHKPQAPGLAWPLRAGWWMSRDADVGLACTSYAITVPWRIPGATIVWDFAPFDRVLSPPRGSAFERLTLPLALHRCARLVAISQATREELERRFPASRGRTAVAPPAADARFAPELGAGDEAVLARLGLDRPYALVTGTLEPRKNLPRLIEAFARLDPDLRAGWKLVLAGAPGWETDATFASVAEHRELVTSLGFVPEEQLPALYRGASLFAYVSLYEGFGLPVLEAMQSGTAVLTSSVSSMPEVGGEAVRYANPHDVDDIRRGLAELIGDAALRERCARSGVERARGYDWDATAAAVLAALDEAARAPS